MAWSPEPSRHARDGQPEPGCGRALGVPAGLGGGSVTPQPWSPASVRQGDPSIVLPASLTTVEDFLQLPLRSFTTSVGQGDVLPRGFQPVRTFDTLREYPADQWAVGPRVVVNAALALSYEPGVLNDDLRKPDWLAPLVGGDRLEPPVAGANLSGTMRNLRFFS